MPPKERLGRVAKFASLFVPVPAGLTASAALLVDYLRPSPVFCADGGGCEVVRRTIFSEVAGIPTPVFGVLAFLLFGVLAIARGPRARVALMIVSSLGAAAAALLLYVQAMIGVFCKFCVVADLSMLLVALAAWYRYKRPWDVPLRSFEAVGGMAVLAAALVLPIVTGMRMKAEIPGVIAEELQKTPKGQVTVIDFVDFECPFCRMTHEELAPLLEARRDRLRVIRKNVPLTRIHPHAMDAARAACCAEAMGKGDQMAEALFRTDVDQLTPDGCERIAESIGLARDPFRACVGDPKTDARIEADVTTFKAARGHGLPTIWIGEQKFEGAYPGETLQRALDGAMARAGS